MALCAVSIDDEMRASYLDYAMSVIISTRCPMRRFQAVHQRILYAMNDMDLIEYSVQEKRMSVKCLVSTTRMATLPSDAMALAQDFSLRYPLVDGQGNFGSVDGDSPAAMRYTEARLAAIAETVLRDIDQDTVDWQSNFDDSLLEPQVLPAMLPNLLLNGTSGIAVGMATNIPPHNLSEIADAIAFVIDEWERRNEIGLEELMEFVKGPDFPTGGIILGTEGIRQALGTGRGRVILRQNQHRRDEQRQIPHYRHGDPVPGQQVGADRAHGGTGAQRCARPDQRSAQRRSHRHAHCDRAEARRCAKKVRNRLFKHTRSDHLWRQHAGAGRRTADDACCARR